MGRRARGEMVLPSEDLGMDLLDWMLLNATECY